MLCLLKERWESAFGNLDNWAADFWTVYGSRITWGVFKTQLLYCLLILTDYNSVMEEKERVSRYGKFILVLVIASNTILCNSPC